MSATTEINQQDLSRFRAVLKNLKGLEHDDAFFDVIGASGASLIHHNLTTTKQEPQTATPWVALNEDYAKKKAENSSGGILDYTGAMIDSANSWNLLPQGGVEWGSNMVYAARQHYGFVKGGKTITPARPWLAFSDENIDEMHQEATEYVEKMVSAS